VQAKPLASPATSSSFGAPLRAIVTGPDKSGTRRFSYVIASDFEHSRGVQDAIMDAVQAMRFSENDVFAIRLALEEAMINAIKHGNKLDPSKTVTIDAVIAPDEVDITIQDQGRGFSKADIPDPTLEENLEKNSGRGIMLIEAYMSSAEWTDGGRRLRMRKSREAQLAAS
jgi:serine/threonine-protein kinase RsbW